MAQLTEYDPTTLKRVHNHDAARRQKELEQALERLGQGNTQVGQPGQNEPQPPAPVVTGSEPTNALAETVIEFPDSPTPDPAPAPVIETPATATITPDEIAKLQKSYREAQQALTPALQKAAALNRRLEEEQATTQAELKAMRETLAHLTDLVKQRNEPVVPIYRPEEDDELAALDPIVADRFRRFSQSSQERLNAIEAKHQKEIQELKDQEKDRQKAMDEARSSAMQQNWNDTFVKLVPDYQDFLPGAPKAEALSLWANTMPAEYAGAIGNPRAYTPFFLAMVINQFKATSAPATAPTRQPAAGDLATRSLGTAPARIVPPQQDPPLTADQVRNAQKIMDGLMRAARDLKNSPEIRMQKSAEAADFMARFERLAPK